MIKESRVRDFLNTLPSKSFLRQYVIGASKMTTAPAVYHIVGALTCLSSMLPYNVGISHAGASLIRGNFYGVLVGRSGDDQKSTACMIAKEVIQAVNVDSVQPNPASAEGLQESLGEYPKQTLVYSEFGLFLTQTKTGYGESLKTLLTDLWDCTPQSRRKAKKDESIRIDNPRLSVIAGCAIPFLSEHTSSEDWTGGFLSRWFFIHGNKERINSFPNRKPSTSTISTMVDSLRARLSPAYQCIGIDDEAYTMWDTWFQNLQHRKLPKIIAGLKSRIPTHCLRIVILMAFDLGITRDNWLITTQVLSIAIEITEMYIDSLISLAEELEPDDESRVRKAVMLYLKEHDGFGSLGEFIREYRYPVLVAKTAIEWLAIAGYIDKITHTDHTKKGEREDIIISLRK